MKGKSLVAAELLAVFVLSMIVNAGFAAPATPQEKGKEAKGEKVFIPKEVKAVIQGGLAERQGRQDIPVSLDRQFYLPAQMNLYHFIYVKMKNADLGFAQPGAQPGAQPQAGGQLQANINVFLQFNKVEAGKAPQIVREIYIPTSLAEDAASFDPQKENLYSFGYPLPPGGYVLALAVTTLDLKKIGTLYVDFTLPDAQSFAQSMEATFLFPKKMENLDAPETRTILHKDYFSYSVLKVYPNLDNTFAVGENLEILMFAFGVQPTPTDPQKVSLETNFEVKKGDEAAIKWAVQTYESPLIMQPLPLKQTIIKKTGDKEEKETRDLPPGKYTLNVNITDKTSGKTLTKSVAFEVK